LGYDRVRQADPTIGYPKQKLTRLWTEFFEKRYSRVSINQGDIYWIQLEDTDESELGHYSHPYVIIQDDVINHSRVMTTGKAGGLNM
jgi:hypothetical protein